MGGRIIAAKRNTGADQSNHNQRVRRAECQHEDETDKESHLGDEHLLAAVTIGQIAERGGANQNAEQRGRGDHPFFKRAQPEFLGHQGQRDCLARGHGRHVFGDITDTFLVGQVNVGDLMSAEEDAVAAVGS